MQLCDCWKPPEGNFYFQMFLLILVLITHSFFCFFHLSTFFSSSRKTKTFRQMIFNSGFLFFIFLMFSSERRQRRRKKCIGIRSCKLNRHHAFAVYFPRESVTSDDILMSVLDPEIHSSHSNLKILSIFQKSLFMQLSLNIWLRTMITSIQRSSRHILYWQSLLTDAEGQTFHWLSKRNHHLQRCCISRRSDPTTE